MCVWKKIDDMHPLLYLKKELRDRIFYCRESNEKGFNDNHNNQLLFNFKKRIDAPALEINYKNKAIEQFLTDLGGIKFNGGAIIVPAIRSLPRTDEKYDSSIDYVALQLCFNNQNLLYEPILNISDSIPAAHITGNRNIEKIKKAICVEELSERAKSLGLKNIIIIDDVITSGAHFTAMYDKLSEKYNGFNIYLFSWFLKVRSEMQ